MLKESQYSAWASRIDPGNDIKKQESLIFCAHEIKLNYLEFNLLLRGE